MSFNPFFDVSDLTTDELLKKQAEIGKKMVTARAAGGEFDVYYSENRKEGDL